MFIQNSRIFPGLCPGHAWPLTSALGRRKSLLNGGERGLSGARFVSNHAPMTLSALVSGKGGIGSCPPATAPVAPI